MCNLGFRFNSKTMRNQWMARILALVSAASIAVPAASAWGLKGHQMQVRTALRLLPKDMPAFFLASEEAMVLLGTEPDRWRTPQTPALTETTGPDHFFSWEIATHPLPADRTLFLA